MTDCGGQFLDTVRQGGHPFLEALDSLHDDVEAFGMFDPFALRPPLVAFAGPTPQPLDKLPGHGADGLGLLGTLALAQESGGEAQDFGLLAGLGGPLAKSPGLGVTSAFEGQLAGVDGAFQQLGGVTPFRLDQGPKGDSRQFELTASGSPLVLPGVGSPFLLTGVFAGQLADDCGPFGTAGVLQELGGHAEELRKLPALGGSLANRPGLLIASAFEGQLPGVHGQFDQVGGVVALGLDEGLDGVSHDLDPTADDVPLGVPLARALVAVELASHGGGDALEPFDLVVATDLPQGDHAVFETFEDLDEFGMAVALTVMLGQCLLDAVAQLPGFASHGFGPIEASGLAQLLGLSHQGVVAPAGLIDLPLGAGVLSRCRRVDEKPGTESKGNQADTNCPLAGLWVRVHGTSSSSIGIAVTCVYATPIIDPPSGDVNCAARNAGIETGPRDRLSRRAVWQGDVSRSGGRAIGRPACL